MGNNYNICPRCGTANSAVAKFCFQCGAQLKTAEQPIVCGKCNAVNSSSSAYCKSCGSELSNGNNSKVCPRCKSIAPSGATICSKCGYSFSGSSTIEPISNPNGSVLKPPKRIKSIPVGATKARVGGIIQMVFALALIYFVMMPSFLYIPSADMGIYALLGTNYTVMSGSDIIVDFFSRIGTSGFTSYIKSLTANQWIIYIFFTITMLTAFVQFFAGLSRTISGKMAKKTNGFAVFMLIMCLLSLVYLILCQYAGTIALSSSGVIANIFRNWSRISTTILRFNYYLMSCYYLVLIILSAIFRKPKQQVMQIGR